MLRCFAAVAAVASARPTKQRRRGNAPPVMAPPLPRAAPWPRPDRGDYLAAWFKRNGGAVAPRDMYAADEVCALSYVRSGSHLTRFVLEYLTGRPTSGCPGQVQGRDADPPIYRMSAQASGAAFDALRHVDGSKRPAAMKFHCPELGSSCHKPCTPNIRRCAALLFVARDPLDVVCDDTQTKWFSADRVASNVRWWTENFAFFSSFRGRKLLAQYERALDDGPALVGELAAFLDGGGRVVLPEKRKAMEANYYNLSAAMEAFLHGPGKHPYSGKPSTVGRPLYERFLRCAKDRQDSAARSLALELARGDGLTELWASLYANRTARLGAVFARNGLGGWLADVVEAARRGGA